jgi:hypothetical protein
MGKMGGEPHGSDGQSCPALKFIQKSEAENAVNIEAVRAIQATSGELAAIQQMLANDWAAPWGGEKKSDFESGKKQHLIRPVATPPPRLNLTPNPQPAGGHPLPSDGRRATPIQRARDIFSLDVDKGKNGHSRPAGMKLAGIVFLYAAGGDGQGRGMEQCESQCAHQSGPEPVPVNDFIHTIGRLRYRAGFGEVWVGDELYDLRRRAKARFCLQYLFEKAAFDAASALHFEKQINPHVRKLSKLEPQPDYAEIKIHHYFNPSTGKIARLGRTLIRSAGRGSGRYFLNIR